MSRPRPFLLAPFALGLVPLLAAVLPQEPPRRVVLVSFDGAGGAAYERQRDAGTFGPDGFLRAERTGFSARRLTVVTPSLTAVSHMSISTGAWPSATGIVSNLIHPAGASLSTVVSGFDAEPDVETIWESAARQGKRIAALAWPGFSHLGSRTTPDVGLRWSDPETRSTLFRGPLPEGQVTIALPPGVLSYSPPRPFAVEVPTPSSGKASLSFVALDTADDGRRAYDELAALDPSGRLRGRLRPGEWLAIPEEREGVLAGRWVKLVALAPDLSHATVYASGLSRTRAIPVDFQRTLDRRLGFWPGPPDAALLAGEADPRGFLEQAGRLTQFLAGAFEIAERRGDWDLLLAYQPVVDEAGHVLTLTDPRQPGFTPERAAAAAAAMREVWKLADRAAAQYLRFASTGDVAFVSDHGMRAVARSVYPLELMRRNGLATLSWNGGHPSVAAGSPANVVVSGGTAHVVVNRQGTLPGGVVPSVEAERLVDQIAAVFRALRDEAGSPVFETVVRPSAGTPPGLDHPNAGDLVVIAAGATALRAGLPPGGEGTSLFGPPDIPGQHGFGPDPELDGIFFHVGDGIGAERVDEVPAIAVAPRLSKRLAITAPGAR